VPKALFDFKPRKYGLLLFHISSICQYHRSKIPQVKKISHMHDDGKGRRPVVLWAVYRYSKQPQVKLKERFNTPFVHFGF